MYIDYVPESQKTVLPKTAVRPSILLAVGENPQNHFGAKFLASFFSNNKNVKISLLHILPPEKIEHRGPYGMSIQGGRMDDELYSKHATAAKKALTSVHDLLLDAGLDEDNISIEARSQKGTTAEDIFSASVAGNHSALLLGKRGRSWLEDVFAGIPNITQEIITASCGMPIWTAFGHEHTNNNILLCVDGSRSSHNIAKHVGKTLAHSHGHSITMLRVLRKNTATQKTADQIFKECSTILQDEGIREDRLNYKVLINENIPQAIITEANNGQYAVVAAGRSGAGNSFVRNLLIGSVSLQLWQKLDKNCFWMTC